MPASVDGTYPRHIELEGAYNVRDLGGYTTRKGQVTRWRRVFRADSLHRLTMEDQEKLADLGIRTILDLRRPDEVSLLPNVFAGTNGFIYTHIALFGNPPRPRRLPAPPSLAEIYRHLLDDAWQPLVNIFRHLALHSDQPLLFHCTAGKDRTGLVAALLLAVADVTFDQIAADYALSKRFIEPMMDELRAGRPAMIDVGAYERLLDAEPSAMLETLGYLQSAYGGSAGYLRSIGLSEDDIMRLRRLLLPEP
ncbi:MAG: tyrosine-protein phosphatase [Anaerolineae bacterium]|nr:tyrosine-protein phosphatase [Anaerolineae bacterium]